MGSGQQQVFKFYHFFLKQLTKGLLEPINFSTSPAIFPWRPAAWLQISGADAASFLQGQFTNDLRALDRVPAVYGLWLTVKGKVLADSFVLRAAAPGAFWVGSYRSTVAVIRERLESFVIADDVTITDETDRWTGFSVFGAAANAAAAGDRLGGVLFPGRRTRGEHREWVVPAAQAGAARARLAAWPEAGAADVERVRILDTIPAVPADIGPGDLPNEAGLDAEAVSYTKGCYLGQEVMARLKSMGQVRRRLVRVRAAAGGVPALPAPLWAGPKQVGEVRSAVADAGGLVGLAMISLLGVGTATTLALAPDGPATVGWEPSS